MKNLNALRIHCADWEACALKFTEVQPVNTFLGYGNLEILLVELYPFVANLTKRLFANSEQTRKAN
jgi:hypothetical protein